jgi:hypothetical protein
MMQVGATSTLKHRQTPAAEHYVIIIMLPIKP